MDINPENSNKAGLQLGYEGIQYLLNISKWSRFIAIIGFIMVGFTVIIGLGLFAFASTISAFALKNGPEGSSPFLCLLDGGFMSVSYLLIALFYFIPLNYLYKFSTQMKVAIETLDSNLLTQSFKNLKSHYKFIGIITLIIVSLYGLAFLTIVLSGATALLTR